MKNIEREQIKKDYIEKVYKKSWTFERLTFKEQQNIIGLLTNTKLFGNNIHDIVYELERVYSAFLTALGYNAFGWREPYFCVFVEDNAAVTQVFDDHQSALEYYYNIVNKYPTAIIREVNDYTGRIINLEVSTK